MSKHPQPNTTNLICGVCQSEPEENNGPILSQFLTSCQLLVTS